MSWVAVAVAGAAVVGSVVSSRSASKSAARAAEATEWQGDLAYAQWERYVDKFAPLEDKIVKEAQAPVEEQPGFGRLMATVNRGYSDLEGNVKRTMGGRYPSGAGLERQAVRNVKLQKTTAETGAVADMMTQRYNRMLQAANLGRGLPATSIAGASGAAQNETLLASMYAKAAQGSWDSTGTSLGNLMKLINTQNTGMAVSPYSNYSMNNYSMDPVQGYYNI